MPAIPLELTEPKSARYIYIDPKSNRVHLMLPVVSGPEGIGLDNTCKAVYAVQEFFGKSKDAKAISALDSLKRYQEALVFDIRHLPENSEAREQKEDRLKQVKVYITLLEKMKDHELFNCLSLNYPEYPSPLQRIMKDKAANLYSMVLRPHDQDTYLRTVNPIFSLPHDIHDAIGNLITQASSFSRIVEAIYKTIDIKSTDKRAELIKAVLASEAGITNNFAGLQQALTKEIKNRLGETIDFSQKDKAFIDEAMGYDETSPAREYIDALLGYCAPNVFDSDNQSPFNTIEPGETEVGMQEARDKLSILTQFFLAQTNIYSVTKEKTIHNFGDVLEKQSETLGTELAVKVKSSYLNGASIEDTLLDFINTHYQTFGLTTPITEEEQEQIKQQFKQHYSQIKASPHFDEFMVVDTEKPGLFVSHQGAICTDLATFMQAAIAEDYTLKEWNNFYLKHVHEDFKTINGKLSHENQTNLKAMEEEINQIMVDIATLTDESLRALIERLPTNEKKRVCDLPEVKARLLVPNFLLHVARGEQDPGDKVLTNLSEEDKQTLLLRQGTFTDYSGRTFHCSGFEYAYWAKDTHMARMLLKHMSEETKAEMSQRIETMEQQGLKYTLDEKEITSKHFDFTPLKTAFKDYLTENNNWKKNWDDADALRTAWLAIGKEQRQVPVHVVNEYCYPNRSFSPCPSFTEATLPRNLTFNHYDTSDKLSFFPLLSPTTGPGFDFTLVREAGERWPEGVAMDTQAGDDVGLDSAAIDHLDEVRTAELIGLREQLGQALDHSPTGLSL